MPGTVGIIGGGVAGLAAGGFLCQKGWKVKLFEANEKPGGCCTTTNVEGFTFNDGALYIAIPEILDHVFARLGLDRDSLLPLRKITANHTVTLDDGSVVRFGDGLAVTVTGAKGHNNSAKLQRELDAFMIKWEPVMRLFAGDLLVHPPSVSRLIRLGWRHLNKFHGTVASEINGIFSDESVRSAMSGLLLYTGLPPEKTPVFQILGLVAMFNQGFFLPLGGMGKLPEVLSQSLSDNGGEIYLNSKVQQIEVRNGHVCGLEIDGQGLVELDAVISTVSGMLTYGSLLPPVNVPRKMKQKVQGAQLSHKALCLQLGLSNRLDAQSHSNSILPMMNEQHKFFIPDREELKWFNYTVPTITMPELAPPGGSVIEMFPPIDQDVPVDNWNEQKKEKIAELAIRALSRLHKLDIVAKRVIGPGDYRDGMHLFKGAAYGLSPATDPMALFAHQSPIPGLYQAGQTTYPGYGVATAACSGILAAELCNKKTGR
jgi:phytoene desaturase